MFEGQIAGIRHKFDLALKTTAGALVAFAAAVIALGFFCAAGFLWIEERRGAIEATLILGGAFVVLALIALVAIVVVQRRKPPPPRPAARPLWADPAMLAAALDVSRALGRRRGVAVGVVIAAFVIGALLPRTPRRDED